jgi:hypothetical protein
MPPMTKPTMANPINRMSRLFDCSNGNKIKVFSPTPTEAIIAQGVRTTGLTTMATGRTTTRTTSPNQMLPETVNFVYTAKS